MTALATEQEAPEFEEGHDLQLQIAERRIEKTFDSMAGAIMNVSRPVSSN